MPSNVSTPIWQCDICKTTHGDHRDRAELCESAGEVSPLPAGTPLLTTDRGRLRFISLTPTGRILTAVTPYQSTPGHQVEYAEGDTRRTLNSRDLHPHTAGHLQIETGNRSGRLWHIGGYEPQPTSEGLIPAFYAALLNVPETLRSSRIGGRWDAVARWVQPITPEVRTVLDALDIRLDTRRYGNRHQDDTRRENYLLRITGGNQHRTNGLSATTPPEDIDATIRDLQERWWAGENVTAPWPNLTSRSTLTPSKAPKAIRELLAATGTPWAPRTSPDGYARTLIKDKLMTTTHATNALFGDTPIIGVGGVKGGTGKSTVASAFAKAAADTGKNVILIDLDLDDPTLPTLFDLPDHLAVNAAGTGILPTKVTANLSVISHGQIPAGVLPTRWSATAAVEWLRFLAETVDTDGTDLIVLDLPAGQGPIVNAVLASSGEFGAGTGGAVDTLIAVGSPDPYTLTALERSLRLQMHEKRALIVVENLGRITGTTATGETIGVRPHGPEDAVRTLAEASRATYAGSLPYVASWEHLADSPEMAALVDTALAGVPVSVG